jgi:hypothetical protein
MIEYGLIFAKWAIAFGLTALLWAIAALHVYWGNGGLWPEQDEISLAKTVIGAPAIQHMPGKSACFQVAGGIFLAGLWPLMITRFIPSPFPAEIMVVAGYMLAAIFLGRGAAAYHPAFRKRFPEEPFATLDRQRYGPLCIGIGLAFIILLSLGSFTS